MVLQQTSPEELGQERKEKEQAKRELFQQKDYELKITYLTNQFTRMWTRFNYFVAIETALVGGKFLIPNGVLTPELAVAGAIISALWYVMGAEDRYLVRLYRHQVKEAAEAVSKTIWTEGTIWKSYQYVGQADGDAIADLREAESYDREGNKKSFWKKLFEFEWLSGWRWERISTTRLAALFPLLVFVLWVVIFFYEPAPSQETVTGGSMKIAIISDIHDNVWKLEAALGKIKELQPDALFCCGDLCSPFIVGLMSRALHDERGGVLIPIHVVFGNNDADLYRITQQAVGGRMMFYGELAEFVAANGKVRPRKDFVDPQTKVDYFFDPANDGKRIAIQHFDYLARPIAASGKYAAVFYGHNHRRRHEHLATASVINPGAIMGYDGADKVDMLRPLSFTIPTREMSPNGTKSSFLPSRMAR